MGTHESSQGDGRVETLSGAGALVQALEKLGVDYVFGYPGGAALPIFDLLYSANLNFVLVRHEQSAAHMADGYARATGKPAVVLVTSGPGATNTVTGIYTAFMDSVPMLVLCGQVGRSAFGKDSFQEVDIQGISTPIVKCGYSIRHPDEVPFVLEEAWHVAQSGRPGPVLVDLPKDMMTAACSFPKVYPRRGLMVRGFDGKRPFNQARELARMGELLRKARRPVLLVGHGAVISRAHEEVLRLAERLRAPVTSTLLGKGGFPERHPLALGMAGMHGTAYANLSLTRCDLIFSIGSRWDDRVNGDNKNFCKGAVKLHIDIDPAEVGKIVKPDAAAVGDARALLRQLEEYLDSADIGALDTQEWLEELECYKQRHPLKGTRAEGEKGLKAQEILARLDELLKTDYIATTDVGQHQMWAAQFLRFDRPERWISSGGAGTMGFGFPAAIGCQLAHPTLPVVAVVGDGGFQMTFGELATAVRLKLPLKILLLDNKYLGMVRQWQDMFFENRLSGVDLSDNPDFVKLAEAFGARGFSLRHSSEIDQVLREALAYDQGPCLIHAEVEKEAGVFPMVPSGQSADKMMLAPPADLTEEAQAARKRPALPPPPPVQPMESVFLLRVLATQQPSGLFLRIGFVMSKKMFTLLSYVAVAEKDEQQVEQFTTLSLVVKGPAEEIQRLVGLVKNVVGVLDVGWVSEMGENELEADPQALAKARETMATYQ